MIRLLAACDIDAIKLFLQNGDAVAEFDSLAVVEVVVDVACKAEIEQLILLLAGASELTLQFLGLILGGLLVVAAASAEHFAEPGGGFVVLLHRAECRQQLFVEFPLGHTVTRMNAASRHGAAVVDVLFARLLRHLLGGDQVAAVPAADQSAGIGKGGVVSIYLLAQERLHLLECRVIDQRRVLAGVVLAFPLNLADVRPVAEHGVNAGACELR